MPNCPGKSPNPRASLPPPTVPLLSRSKPDGIPVLDGACASVPGERSATSPPATGRLSEALKVATRSPGLGPWSRYEVRSGSPRGEHLAQPVGVVGDEAVHAVVDELVAGRRVVDRPGNDLHAR